MAKIKQTILDIAEANGYEGGEPKTIIGALDALTDAVAGDDEDGGTSINGAVKALAPYIGGGGGGGSFGEMLLVPMVDSAAPTVGGSAESAEGAKIIKIGTSAETDIVSGSGEQLGVMFVAAGLYITVMPSSADVPSVDGYVVTLDMQTAKYATVAQWDGTITLDTTSVEGFNCFGFTMPELEQSEYLILVFSGSTDSGSAD